jgi:hypothetical protein
MRSAARRVEVTSSGVSVTGRLLSVERDMRQEIGRYLDVVGSTREQDARSMVISTDGQGERSLFVSYVSEVPIWKSTYRLVLPAANGGKPLLQGWAVVDNTIDGRGGQVPADRGRREGSGPDRAGDAAWRVTHQHLGCERSLDADRRGGGVPAAELERALRPVLERRAALTGVQLRLAALTQETQSIAADQERVRENMRALRGSSEEKQLLQRYTRQLNQREDRLAAP